jgi:hypothetical protein
MAVVSPAVDVEDLAGHTGRRFHAEYGVDNGSDSNCVIQGKALVCKAIDSWILTYLIDSETAVPNRPSSVQP